MMCECTKSELELFTVPPTNISMESGSMIEYLPISSVGDSGPIEFHVSTNDDYVDLGRTFLYVKVRIKNVDGTDLAADAKVGPVNNWMHSLFSQVDLQINGKLISPSVNTYPYKAYLETLLSYGSDAKAGQLGSDMWFMDNGNVEAFDPYNTDPINTGFKARSNLVSESTAVEMMGRLHCDLFQQDRYLLNGVDLSIKLIRSPVSFHLMGDAVTYNTVIEDVALFVRKVKLNPSIPLEHNKMLNQGRNVKYPIRRGVVTTFTISQGNMSINKDNVILGQLPRRVIVGLVTNRAFNGSIKHNPFNFQHFDLNHLSLYAGGIQYPNKPLKPDFDNNLYLRSFMTLFEGTGLLNDDRGHGITRNTYKNGCTLYAFDLTADMAEGSHVDPIKHGSLRMDLHFKKALTETVNVVVYSEYDNVIQIDRARNVIVDF
jgi:hypothetical protein